MCLKSLFGSPSFQTPTQGLNSGSAMSQKPIRLTVLSDAAAQWATALNECLKSLFGSPSFQTSQKEILEKVKNVSKAYSAHRPFRHEYWTGSASLHTSQKPIRLTVLSDGTLLIYLYFKYLQVSFDCRCKINVFFINTHAISSHVLQ